MHIHGAESGVDEDAGPLSISGLVLVMGLAVDLGLDHQHVEGQLVILQRFLGFVQERGQLPPRVSVAIVGRD